LLIGKSQKQSDSARVKYGEGYKLAHLVATRLGMTLETQSHELHIVNSAATTYGEPVFQLTVSNGSHYQGTQHRIKHWAPLPIYENRFLREGNSRVLSKCYYGSLLRGQDIYTKGVWTRSSQDEDELAAKFHFGYDLEQVTTNRDREVVDLNDLLRETRQVWRKVSNPRLWAELFRAVKDEKLESQMNFSYAGPYDREAVTEGWKLAFGKGVLATTEAMIREAEWRGAILVKLPENFTAGIKAWVPTDQGYVAKRCEDKPVAVKMSSLSDYQKHTIANLRRLAKELWRHRNIKIVPAVLPATVRGQWHGLTETIYISVDWLDIREDAMSIFIHEIAHVIYGANDATGEMVRAVAQIGAVISTGYVWRKR